MMPSGLTVKTEALVNAVASGKYHSQRAAAKAAGMHETHASEVLRKPKVQEALERRKAKLGDNARDLARASLSVARAAIATDIEDPLAAMQAAHGGVTVAAKYAEAFETTGESPEELATTEDAFQQRMLRAMVIGARWCMSRSDPVAALERLKARVKG